MFAGWEMKQKKRQKPKQGKDTSFQNQTNSETRNCQILLIYFVSKETLYPLKLIINRIVNCQYIEF